jgi:hypothetical protein
LPICIASVGCSSVKEIDRDRNVGGYNMKATRLVVATDFSFKSESSALTIAAGEYEATLVDNDGVYFSSPKGVLVDGSNRKGGVYVENDGKPTQVWVSSVFTSKIAAIPREFKYELAPR